MNCKPDKYIGFYFSLATSTPIQSRWRLSTVQLISSYSQLSAHVSSYSKIQLSMEFSLHHTLGQLMFFMYLHLLALHTP